ncbi:NAD-dependent epimerase/dehydratase family protein, partial [Candidatus Micrarchaeota archaeon]|nr:NAD-dependent epimerase/dehydratase family protein [Candidatus Micrarchaeota archaeon]
LVSVPKSIENPELTERVNVQGTKNVLNAAVENGVEKVVLASSSAVYGNNSPPLKESMLSDPLNPYAKSKLQNEKDAAFFYEKHGLKTISLRYFNVYGPGQDPASQYAAVIPKFISALKSGNQPIIYGDGSQTRDFIYVKDVVKANVLASQKNVFGKSFNIGTGNPITIISLLKKISNVLEKQVKPVFKPAREGEIMHSYADTSLAKELLDFEPEWNLEKGLKQTADSI